MSSAVRPLEGPIPMPAGAYDLAALGYVEEEFLLFGNRRVVPARGRTLQ
jgi:hypothetical protein